MIVLLSSQNSFSQSRLFQDLSEIDSTAPKIEVKVVFPKNPPQEKDLVPFTPSADSKTLQFFLDSQNITVVQNIVQYVVVIRSPEGSQQTLLAGLNCSIFLKRTYASLQNGVWQAMNDNEWRPVSNLGYNNYPAYLGRKAFCAGETANSNVSDIMFRLKDNDQNRYR
jgi:hypothetical protein